MPHQTVSHEQRREWPRVSVAGLLSLAAAPTFAIMALLTATQDGSMLCAPESGAWPLTGMVPMYVLMSAFHLSPWLKLITNRRTGVCPS